MHLITNLEFSIMSPEMVKNLARVRIVTSELYDADGYPVEGGVMDPRLGVIDPGLHCRTCGGTIGDCPGHFGYLELAKSVINVLYTKTVYQLLKLTCKKCNRIMVKDIHLEGGEEAIEDLRIKAPLKCPYCSTKQKKVTFVKPYTYYEDKDELSPDSIRERLEKIPNGDLKKISFSGGRPEWLILTLFPIPPVTMRPSITLESGERSEDDLTHKLVDIVRINQSLKENIDIGAPEFILNDLWELVQYHISTYFDNELTGAPLARHRSGRALKGLVQRLKAKEGRIRGNLLGKRVNFSARTVISPDPNLSINEVGVPEVIANELTIPEYVTPGNIKQIKDMLKDNKVNYVVRPDARRIKVTEDNKKDIMEKITADWQVDRKLQDGDIVLFNRQPSLHRISIMAHRVKVMPYQTFRMNPSVCPPYNADFDGDEMNLHALQSEESRAEAAALMEVKDNIISPKFGGPLIGCDLDQISGLYMLTQDAAQFSREEAAQLLADAKIEADLPEREMFSGKDMFSLLLPRELNMEYKTNKGVVVIQNGQLKSGMIDAGGVGAFKGRIINKVLKLKGSDAVKDFIDRSGRLGVAYLNRRGISIGLSDIDLSPEIQKTVRGEIDKSVAEANSLIDKYENDEISVLPGLTPKASLEAQIMNVLANGVSRVSDIVGENLRYNDIIQMAESGAKGSIINTTQMAAVVGQETILGKRIKRGYLRRTLPHIRPGDLSPMSHGFVARGFKHGLTPFELFWNIMNGREGLMDKSLRTRKSGYMQRRLVNALQDLKIEFDNSIRDANGFIVQFNAGEDGIDPTKSDWGKLNWKEIVEKSVGK
ncbi:MAG: DNA-directed RNA polymerase subunit A' [Candidatus Aenigmarchaeota archaeon]|nr:DNA-directed RNA polymerase subunit A' [Candidatus Aenigmarchaeota archaeon]